MEDIKEFGKQIKITIYFYVLSLVVVASGAWYVSDIHTRFQLQNDKIQYNLDKVNYVDDRHDRKYERLQQRIKELEKELHDGTRKDG